MESKKEKIINIIKFLILAFSISLFAVQPYLNKIFMYTHDLGYHLNRIIEISKNLNINVFPSFIHAGLLNNLGYANSLFYPELFLYIPALLMSAFDLHALTVYRIFLFFITFFTFITTFISALGIFKRKSVAWLTTILYIFSLYRLTDIYVRGALGEVLSFIFIPLIFYGLYEIIFGENKKWWIIAIGLWGLANSHLLTFIMMLIVIILICILNVDKIFKDKKILLNLIIAAIISILLCIGFMGPMLEQKVSGKFNFDGPASEPSNIVKYRLTSMSLILGSSLKSGYAVESSVNPDEMSEGIGAILLILAGLIMFRKKLSYKENRFEIQLFVLGCFSYFMTTTLFPWDKFEFLSILQFPFRINMIPTICFSLVGAHSFYEIVHNKKDMIIIFSIIILTIYGYVLSNVNLNFNERAYPTFEAMIEKVQVGNGEYLPIGSEIEDLDLYNINDKENTIDFNQIGSKIEFEYNEANLDFEINIPLIYYKGYKANIVDSSGKSIELKVVENMDNGHILLKSDEKLTGNVTVEYKMTAIQFVCYMITNITMLVLIIYIIRKRSTN